MIALVGASVSPKPDLETPLLVKALADRGAAAQVLPWTADVEWAAFALVVLRTPWDYFRQHHRFTAWLDSVARIAPVINDPQVVRWNTHKRYLLDLERAGIPVVSTRILSAGSDDWMSTLSGRNEVVAKPAISVGAIGALRGHVGAPELHAHIATLLADGQDVLVQPFISSVLDSGEVSLVYFGGRYSHAVRKLPARGDYRVQDHHGGSVLRHTATALQLQVARAALRAVPDGSVAYARVDLVEAAASPLLMELELIEPELFLRYDDYAAGRFADCLIGLAAAK